MFLTYGTLSSLGPSEKCDGRLLKFEISNRKLAVSAIDIGWAHTYTKLMNIVTCYRRNHDNIGPACDWFIEPRWIFPLVMDTGLEN